MITTYFKHSYGRLVSPSLRPIRFDLAFSAVVSTLLHFASSSLSSRRRYLRRPKVCKSSPNPGRCHPPPPPPPECSIECSAQPEEQTVDDGEWAVTVIQAYNDCFGPDAEINMTYVPANGNINTLLAPENGGDAGEFEFQACEGPTQIKVIFNWPDASTCFKVVTITGEEGPP